MKLPNGFGTVVKLSGTRRNPFVARKTKGWNDKGHPIYQVIGYYPTKEAGLIALGKFNQSPWDVQAEKTTLAELFQLWLEKKAHKLGAGNISCLKSAFKHCELLNNVKYREIKSYHMQDIADNCGCGHSTQVQIKNVFYHLDRFALELEIIDRQFSGLVTVTPAPESNKKPFTSDEIQTLWGRAGEPWVDSVLILLYSGWRISELLGLRISDIDLTAGIMRGGVKSKAGKNRIVPIHSKIFPLIKERYNLNREYLISSKRNFPLLDSTYRAYWSKLMASFDTNHTPHETRHTFRSRLDSAGANKVCIDLLMGHKSADIGERIYTHKTIEELKNTVELISE